MTGHIIHRIVLCAGASALLLPAALNADTSLGKYGTFAGNLTTVSNYVWRGVSQTDNEAALQGELRYDTPFGVYAGVWGSNVNFAGSNGKTATLEEDIFVGYQNSFRGVNYDIGLLHYRYPKTSGLDFSEAYLNLGYKFMHLSVNYSNNALDGSNQGVYYNAGVDYTIPCNVPIMYGVDVSANAGYYRFSGGVYNKRDYADYSLSFTKHLTDKINVGLAWHTTNGGFNAGSLDNNNVVASFSVSM